MRILTVGSVSPYTNSKGYYVTLPLIRLQGKWVEKLGFHAGSKVKVIGKTGEITLKLVKEEKGCQE